MIRSERQCSARGRGRIKTKRRKNGSLRDSVREVMMTTKQGEDTLKREHTDETGITEKD